MGSQEARGVPPSAQWGHAGEAAAPAQPGKPVREPGGRGQRPEAAAAGTRRGCRRGAAAAAAGARGGAHSATSAAASGALLAEPRGCCGLRVAGCGLRCGQPSSARASWASVESRRRLPQGVPGRPRSRLVRCGWGTGTCGAARPGRGAPQWPARAPWLGRVERNRRGEAPGPAAGALGGGAGSMGSCAQRHDDGR